MIGDRIKQVRDAGGLSLRALAEQAGVSAMAISKYERNESTPSSDVLLRLAQALDVRVEYFFRQAEVTLEDIDFRKEDALGVKDEKKILADVRDQLERWLELGQFLPVPWSKPFTVPDRIPAKINSLDEIEDVAIELRKAWELGLNPIPDLIDVLESRGIKVFVTPYDGNNKFNGLIATVNKSPVIVVSETWPGDRQRFTLAHELGHLVLRGRLKKSLNEEKACHRFAGAFIVPKPQVIAVLGHRRSRLEPQELALLKSEYGLSMCAWLFRAHDTGVLPQNRYREMWRFFNERGWRQNEPGEDYPREQTHLFEQLVYHALAEDLISESKAAELLGMPLHRFHAVRNMDSSDEVANR